MEEGEEGGGANGEETGGGMSSVSMAVDSVLPPQEVPGRVNQSVNISSSRSVFGVSGKALCGYSSFSRSVDFGRRGGGGGAGTRRRRKGGGVRGEKGNGRKGGTFGKASRDTGRLWMPASNRARGGRGGGGNNQGPPLSLRAAAARSANNVRPRSRNGGGGGGFLRKRTGYGGAAVQNPDSTANYSNLLHLDPQLHSTVEDAKAWQASGSPRQAYDEGDGLEMETNVIFDQTVNVKLRPLDGPNQQTENGIDVPMQLQLVATVGIVPPHTSGGGGARRMVSPGARSSMCPCRPFSKRSPWTATTGARFWTAPTGRGAGRGSAGNC
jgi:hypothetical protein